MVLNRKSEMEQVLSTSQSNRKHSDNPDSESSVRKKSAKSIEAQGSKPLRTPRIKKGAQKTANL